DAFVPDLTWTGINGQSWDKTSMNWRNSSNLGSVYTDNAKVLFEEAGLAGQNINLAEPLAPGDVLFKSAGNYTLQGVGLLTGTGSVNKTGAGFLTLTHGNTYTGATVLHQGTLSFSQLANGEQPSSIGASPNYGFNWVWKGGTWQYTGGNTSTDRAAVLDKTSAFSVSNAASTVTFMGELSGTGGLIKEGPGKLTLRRSNTYEGPTTIRGGVLEIVPTSASTEAENIIHNGTALGASNQLYFEGGTFRTSSGSTTIYENYPMNFYIKEGTINGFEPYRNANLMMNVYGGGTLNYAITYSRELIQGDWTGFTGTLVANGVGTLTGGERPMLMIDNGVGMPNARIHATGNTKITCYSNNQTIYFGGLTGTSSTTLACGNRLAGGAITWVIGGAANEETDETFEGVINNEVYLNSTTTGTTSLIKEGLGTWRLTNNNPYAGTTTIEGGRLVINGQKTGAGAVLVQQGALAGTGSVAGDVTVAGGVLSPGDGAIGTLTLKANCTLQEAAVVELGLNRAAAQWDKINVEGNMIYNGILRISANGTLAAGDAFKIFNVSGNVSGSFTSIEPAQPGPGLEWQFYPATGVLMVTEPGFVMAPSALALSAGVMPPPDPKVFVTLAWTDNSDNEEHFVIERSTDGHNFFPVGQAAANSSSFTDEDGLLENTEYYYRVKATGLTKESGYSNVASVTTPLLAAPPGLPATPQPVHNAENVMLTNGNLLLQWTGTGNTEQYSVYFGTQPDNLVLLGIVPHSANPQILAIGLQPNTIWYWQVMAANSNGTTVGTLWQFKTAGVPALMPGDYRTVSSGNWGSSAVATNVWETWNGTSWEPTTELPGSNTNTITIRSGHTLSLNATTAATNLVIENGATLRSGLADGATGSAANRNLRVRKGIANFGTFGSSSTAAERINIEIFAANGTVNISGTNRLNVANFNVNPLAEVLEVVIDVDMNLSGYMRSYYSTTPSGTPSQDDDEVTITISQGKTVTIGSSGYLQVGSSPTTNTMEQFGRYTYNIAGTLDMRSTGTSCIVAHSTKASSKTTINVSGRWLTGNAMRLVSAATTVPTGQVEFNITGNGVVDAAARTIGGSGATNLVQANGTTGQAIPFNIAGNGQLRQRVANSNVVYHVATAGIYSPVRLNNAGTAGIFEVGLQTHFDNAVGNTDRMVNRQYNIAPVNAPGANLTIGLGWVAQAQGSLFSVSDAVSIYHHNSGAWQPKEATISGGGTMASPYYATATGYTNFSPFAVGNTDASLPVTLVTFIGKPHDGGVLLQFTTAMEINLKAYQIERSINGTRFETITQISAKPGNGGSQHYVHKDSKAPSGTLYYRLKIIDRDGAYSYSHTIAVKQHESYQPLHVFPNPAKSTINLSHAQAGRNALVKVLDGAGKLVITQRLATGSTLSSLAIGKLPQGIYTIVLVDNVTSTLRFVKE
ncbi:MAG TPA: autotransporter-associated beta strand repeat-containing protein, partial [Phnomibacter sp.]|nr:autotransporter-associated beta strand repeat-containing protein [Phnomibacter sp.]